MVLTLPYPMWLVAEEVLIMLMNEKCTGRQQRNVALCSIEIAGVWNSEAVFEAGLYRSIMQHGPGWRGAVYILSTVPVVEWVLLGSGESNKGQEPGSLYLQLVCRTHVASFGRKSVQQ